MNWTPPYMRQGLYAIETRKLIEASNRATIAAIFERRKRERQEREWLARVKRNHDNGLHLAGRCPFCPVNIYWD